MKNQNKISEALSTQSDTHSTQIQQKQSKSLIQQIISSNQQLINLQMIKIRQLQKQNQQIKIKLKNTTDKYQQISSLIAKQIKQANKGHQNIQINSNFNIEQMLEKIIELQQQLSNCKVQLAIKSAQVMSMNFKKHNNQDTKTGWNQQKIINFQQVIFTQTYHGNKQHKQHKQNIQIIQQWKKICQNYSSLTFKPFKIKQKVITLIKKYIPKSIKKTVWPCLVQNKVGITNALYINLLHKRQKGMVQHKIKNQIQKDLLRSFSGITSYQLVTGLTQQVAQLLQIFHLFRPDISYIQGMTYPIIILIPILGKLKSFQIFCNMVLGNSFFRRMFIMQNNYISVICRCFQLLLKEYSPQIYEQLNVLNIQAEIYIVEWFFTFFSRGLSFQTTLDIWDQLLMYQQLAAFKLALCICQRLRDVLFRVEYEQAISCIRQFGKYIEEESILQLLANHKLTYQKLYKYLQKAQNLSK